MKNAFPIIGAVVVAVLSLFAGVQAISMEKEELFIASGAACPNYDCESTGTKQCLSPFPSSCVNGDQCVACFDGATDSTCSYYDAWDAMDCVVLPPYTCMLKVTAQCTNNVCNSMFSTPAPGVTCDGGQTMRACKH